MSKKDNNYYNLSNYDSEFYNGTDSDSTITDEDSEPKEIYEYADISEKSLLIRKCIIVFFIVITAIYTLFLSSTVVMRNYIRNFESANIIACSHTYTQIMNYFIGFIIFDILVIAVIFTAVFIEIFMTYILAIIRIIIKAIMILFIPALILRTIVYPSALFESFTICYDVPNKYATVYEINVHYNFIFPLICSSFLAYFIVKYIQIMNNRM